MLRSLLLAGIFLLAAASLASAAQSPVASAPPQSDTAKPAAHSSTASAAAQTPGTAQENDAQDKTKKKPKKVWTNEEIGSVKGGVSVVGDSAPASNQYNSSNSQSKTGGSSTNERQIAAYRDQVHQLQAQLDATNKKINELRNFKAENTSASGGINLKQGYTMTPVEDQIKQLEEKKKQIQARIDAVEEDARKNGIEPGQLR